jgi:hypothetical protein
LHTEINSSGLCFMSTDNIASQRDEYPQGNTTAQEQ